MTTERRPELLNHSLPGSLSAHHCPTRVLIQEFDLLVAERLEAELLAGRGASLPLQLVAALCTVVDPKAAVVATRLVTRRDAGPEWTVLAKESRAIRKCAARALRNAHSTALLPSLAALLDSTDLETQYLGLQGLADYANGRPAGRGDQGRAAGGPYTRSKTRRMAPAYDIFVKTPQVYLDFWRNWWTCEPCRLESGAPSLSVVPGGACNNGACVVTFTAETIDPDGDPVVVSWSGCGEIEAPVLSCTRTTPGLVVAHALALDSFGDRVSAASQRMVYAASFTVGPWGACQGSGAYVCTSSGPNGCGRPGTRSRAVTLATLTLDPAQAVTQPPATEHCIQTAQSYATAYTTGPWSACSAPCGGGERTRTVTENAWDDTPPPATPPASVEECNPQQCPFTCAYYTQYITQNQCYAAGWAVCEIRHPPDGLGGSLTCWKGFP
jgi:hypothetical protein